ncbi:hypothetical protein FXB38_19340 [Bradyrhizobium cytisi]|uniref:Uncharacterized protein n=2 Tax=Bradyrhizobium cytisi TaxID=515489 RepID=A0A5S4WN28_9BRAD|nr:hypothetical protein FXB38_19340 [Bradyrhizobium cytisi]
MIQFELSSRAALCRQLASQDLDNHSVWMAEARSWSNLADKTLHDEHGLKRGIVARFFFAFSKLVAGQDKPANHTTEMAQSRSRRLMPSRSLSPIA